MSDSRTTLLFDTARCGHRPGYLAYFSDLAGERPSEIMFGLGLRQFKKLVGVDKVVLSSADHYLPFALAVGMARRLSGKSTAAVFIAAERMHFGHGFPAGLKGLAMRVGRALNFIDGVSIVPFECAPKLEKLCRGWIYDPQFCAPNIGAGDESDESELELLDWASAQRQLVVLLGNLHPGRGLDDMIEAAGKAPEVTFLAAGRLTPAAESLAASTAGLPENFRLVVGSLTMDAFGRLIEIADIVWCYFPSKYDQNSGLFCNAVRAGRNLLVRKESLIHWLASKPLNAREVAIPSWVADDGVILSSLEERENFLRECAERNLSWIQRILGDSDQSPAIGSPEVG